MNKALFLKGELVFGSQNLSDEKRAALKAELVTDGIETIEDDFDDSLLSVLDCGKAILYSTFIPSTEDSSIYNLITKE